MLSFCLNIVNSKQKTLLKWLCMLLLKGYDIDIYQHKWIRCMKCILRSSFNKVVIENPKSSKKTNLPNSIQSLYSCVAYTCTVVSCFKQDPTYENYLVKLDRKHRS